MNRASLAFPLVLSLLVGPLAAEAQQTGRVYTIGFLSLSFPDSGPVWWEVFLGAMRWVKKRPNWPTGRAPRHD